MVRLLLGLIVQTLLFTALIIGPGFLFSGSIGWSRGWIAVAILFAVSALGGLWVFFTDPELARERASLPTPTSAADRIASILILLAVMLWFVFVAWDAHVLHLVALPVTASMWTGIVVFALGLGVILWTFKVNSFAATVVKIQDERQQRVVDNGPYALVRHPMYMGAILFFPGLGLILGSPMAAIVAVPLFAVSFVPRMLIEEKTLRRDLIGYREYQARVRSRIVPKIL